MTQYARPDSDVSVGSWSDSDESGSDLYTYIDEASVDDNDYVYLDMSMEDFTPATFGTSNVTDPESSSDHKVYYRGWADSAGPGMVPGTLVAKLYVGASLVATDPSVREMSDDGSKETFIWTLSTAQANAISSYSDLRLQIVAADPEMTMTNIYCSWAFFECPDAVAPSAATANGSAFMLFLDT